MPWSFGEEGHKVSELPKSQCAGSGKGHVLSALMVCVCVCARLGGLGTDQDVW